MEPSNDDNILEVVAVLGASQMGMSKVFGGMQHHRIAQVCWDSSDNSCPNVIVHSGLYLWVKKKNMTNGNVTAITTSKAFKPVITLRR